MEEIGVRELRQHASRWLARVRRGESFQVTDRGRPVALLVPVADDAWERLLASGAVIDRSDPDLDIAARPPRRSTADVSAALRGLRADER